jgi:ABC-2 type transport system permease protein
VGVVNEAGSSAEGLLAALREVQTLSLSEGTRESELAELARGERAAVAVIPPSYRAGSTTSLTVYTNDGKPQESQLAALVLQQVFDEMAFAQNPPATRVTVTTKAVKARNLTYIDFLIPGILAMSIMQTGIFGVAFGFVSLKKRGILRRLWVTPINPNDFIIAQVLTRLIVLMVQIVIMVGVGILFFNLHFIGSLLDMFIVGLLGGVVFLAIGFALAGISRSEDQVAPLANVITLPMLLLSGVFFSRSNFPGFIHTITDYFPLTYLADGMRSIAIDGASLASISVQLIGLGVWCAVSVFLAVKMFRWE